MKMNTVVDLPPSSSFLFSSPKSSSSAANLSIPSGNGTQQQLQWTQQSNQTGKLIVETLDGLELNEILGDEHASAVHRLIVASVVIALISALLIATVILFRCYMLYCQDYLNIRRYQRPPIEDVKGNHLLILQPNGGLFDPFKMRPNLDIDEKTLQEPLRNGQQHRYNMSFKAIFDDEDGGHL